MEKKRQCLLTIFTLLHALTYTRSQPFIGVNYGEQSSALPPPSTTATLIQSTTISKLRLYTPNPSLLQSFTNVPSVSFTVGTSNDVISSLSSSPSSSSQWFTSNMLPFVSQISIISVGNEVLSFSPAISPSLLPALQNLHASLPPSSSIKISTVHSMSILSSSNPPSSGSFHSELLPMLTPILQFLHETGSPFMINPYPYFAYRDDPTPETLAFCLFQPNLGRFDPGTGITYTNMFDAQLDAIKTAVSSAGFPDVEIVVAETGWPYKGDGGEVGASLENAMAFNGNLVKHLKTMVGTPLMPGKSVDTYIFELYDENLKPGPTSERSFGLFKSDLTMIYDAGLMKPSSNQVSPAQPTTVSTPPGLCLAGTSTCQQPRPSVQQGYFSNAAGSHAAGNLVYQITNYWRHNQWLGWTGRRFLNSPVGFALSLLFYMVVPLVLQK